MNAAKIAEFIEKLVKLKEVNAPFDIVSRQIGLSH